MLAKQAFPVVVNPNVKRLLTGDMLEIRDMILGHIAAVSDATAIRVNEVRIILRRDSEACCSCWEEVSFDVNLDADMETSFEYWGKVSDAVGESGKAMTEEMQDTLSGHVGVGVSGNDFTTFF